MYGVSQPTVRKWFIHYGIERKSQAQISTEVNRKLRSTLGNGVPDKQEFEQLFHSRSIDQLEQHYGVGQQTIYRWQSELEIEDKNHANMCCIGKANQYSDIQFDKETLERLYTKYGVIGCVADELGVSYSYTRRLMASHGIEIANPKRSANEIRLLQFCRSLGGVWESGNRSAIYPLEIDIFNPSMNLGIEYCGSYWHSENWGQKDRNYHRDKMRLCRAAGIDLITVFEGDNIDKVKNLIMSKVGLLASVGARNCTVQIVDPTSARKFHSAHHLAGAIGATTHLGLFKGEDLMMLASFGKARNGKYDFECMRMTVGPYKVAGGASKLFSHFIKSMHDGQSLITYADMRFGQGNVYTACGLERLADTSPNYWYFHRNKPDLYHSRVSFQKHKQSQIFVDFDSNKTEYQNMLDNRYDRIWDCGNAVYTMKKGAPKSAFKFNR